MRHVVNRGAEPYKKCFVYGTTTYTFKAPTKDRVYVKILKFVEKHPGCKRADIQKAVWGEARPGLCSTTFAHMLYANILDYDGKFRYFVPRKGKNILRKLGR